MFSIVYICVWIWIEKEKEHDFVTNNLEREVSCHVLA